MTGPPAEITHLAEAPVEQYLTYRLSRVHAKLTQQASALLHEAAGLSLVAWRLLAILERNGPATITEANRDARMDKGQVSRAVARMLADGLLSSTARDSDHRQHVLGLTDKGRALYDKAAPAMHARRRHLLGHFTPDELGAFLHGLDLLDAASEKRDFCE